jgi:hypothetical protein
MHVFFDLNVNFMQFNVGETLDFISYVAFRCNGTVLIAEIHRRIMSNLEQYVTMYSELDSMYEFLIAINKQITTTCPGSCKPNRYTFSQGSNSTMWNEKQSDLFQLCKRFSKSPDIMKRQSKMYEVAASIIHDLDKSKKFHGVGPMGANLFVQISSLLGLMPLCCYNYAEIKSQSLGPAKLIKAGIPQISKLEDIRQEYVSMHKDLKDILGPQMTMSILENTLCELYRCVNSSFNLFQKINPDKNTSLPTIDSVTTFPTYFKESKMKDFIYHDEKRGCPQNFFRVVLASKKPTVLNPVLVMKHSRSWKLGSNVWQQNLTNWNRDKKDNKMVFWADDRDKMNLKTKLETSHEFDTLMSIHTKQ